jgi:hypothetical protein
MREKLPRADSLKRAIFALPEEILGQAGIPSGELIF